MNHPCEIDRCRVNAVGLGVRAKELDVAGAVSIVEGHDQPVGVAGDVEHDAIVRNHRRFRKLPLDLFGRSPLSGDRLRIPRAERFSSRRARPCIVLDRAPVEDRHGAVTKLVTAQGPRRSPADPARRRRRSAALGARLESAGYFPSPSASARLESRRAYCSLKSSSVGGSRRRSPRLPAYLRLSPAATPVANQRTGNVPLNISPTSASKSMTPSRSQSRQRFEVGDGGRPGHRAGLAALNGSYLAHGRTSGPGHSPTSARVGIQRSQ